MSLNWCSSLDTVSRRTYTFFAESEAILFGAVDHCEYIRAVTDLNDPDPYPDTTNVELLRKNHCTQKENPNFYTSID